MREGTIEARQRALGVVPTVEIVGMLAQRAMQLGAAELRLDALDDTGGDLVLDGEEVAAIAIISLRPELRSRIRIHELHGDAERTAGAAHAALQEIARAQFLRRPRSAAEFCLVEG